MSDPGLFSPLRLGAHVARNRVGFAAISTRFAREGLVTDKLIAHLVRRAQGGAGLVVTEAMVAAPSAAEPVRAYAFDPRNDAMFRRMADAVQGAGALLLGQLWHGGSARLTGRAPRAVGVSPVPDGMSWTVPHVLSGAEIEALVEDYAAAAARLARAGFAGVEISAAHGFLPLQFLSPASNRRADEWGGDAAGRTRFVRALIRAVRARAGAGLLVGLKLPAEDGVPGGIDAEEAERITRAIVADAPPDYLCYSQGNHGWSLFRHAPDMHSPAAPYLHLTRRMRAAAGGVAVAAIGRLGNPDDAARAVADGAADLVMLGRPLLADARWPEFARSGRAAEIRPCIACNYCWGEINRGAPVGCSVNARLGREDELAEPAPPSPRAARARSAPARHIVVVGAGPAGLEAAAVAARRGARVTLLAAAATLGGAARLHARLPGCGDIARALDWQERQAVAAGVTIRRNERAGATAVLALRPDAVVLATGATPAAIEGLESDAPVPDLRALAARLLDRPGRIEGTAVIFDHDHTPMTYDAALLLARMAGQVVILTPRESVARDMPILVAQAVHHRLAEAGIAIEPYALPRAFLGGRLGFAHALTGRLAGIADVALLVAATPRIANDALAAPLRAAGIPVSLVGDAWAPRSMLWAVREGHEAAEALVPATCG